MKVLLLEDDEIIAKQIEKELNKIGFSVDISTNGQDGLFRAREWQYDLMIVDIGLPFLSGIEVIKSLRPENAKIPILILTARGSWQDKVLGLESGADDYLVKPFQKEELLARIQALLRRANHLHNNQIQYGPLLLNVESQEVQLNDESILLTAFEYKLLEHMLLSPKKVMSKMALADYLYEEEAERDSNVIEVIIARLRQKIDPDSSWKPIETLRGRGYRLKSL